MPVIQMAPPARERRPLASSPGGGRHRCAERSERCVPRSRPDDAERRVPAERRTIPELGVLTFRPPAAGCADRRSAFPCPRVALLGGVGAETYTLQQTALSCGRVNGPNRSFEFRLPPNGDAGLRTGVPLFRLSGESLGAAGAAEPVGRSRGLWWGSPGTRSFRRSGPLAAGRASEAWRMGSQVDLGLGSSGSRRLHRR